MPRSHTTPLPDDGGSAPATRAGPGPTGREGPLAGKLADISGTFVLECRIHSITANRAEVELPIGYPVEDGAFLVDIAHHVAYRATVVGRHATALSLAFTQGYALDRPLPQDLRFLRRLLIDARLRWIEVLRSKGLSLTDSLRRTDVTRTAYERWRADCAGEEAQARALTRLTGEPRCE